MPVVAFARMEQSCCCELDHLTTREAEVVTLMAAGLSNREIARQLHISKDTVAHHITNMLQRIDVNNGKELVAYAYVFGIVDVMRWPPAPSGCRCIGQGRR